MLREFRHDFFILRKLLNRICHLLHGHNTTFLVKTCSCSRTGNITDTVTQNLDNISNMLSSKFDPKLVVVIEEDIFILSSTIIPRFSLVGKFIIVHRKQIIHHRLVSELVHKRRYTIIGTIKEKQSRTSSIQVVSITMIPPIFVSTNEIIHFYMKEIGQALSEGGRLLPPNMRVFVESGTDSYQFLRNVELCYSWTIAKIETRKGRPHIKSKRPLLLRKKINIHLSKRFNPFKEWLALFDFGELFIRESTQEVNKNRVSVKNRISTPICYQTINAVRSLSEQVDNILIFVGRTFFGKILHNSDSLFHQIVHSKCTRNYTS
mmetsp:Transcript_14130/g.19793  ORF Transcript_14130/g.19793 Transcript_14130/m.19793 type:complete len:320 (-) Transcript_14130:283-1242(-)